MTGRSGAPPRIVNPLARPCLNHRRAGLVRVSLALLKSWWCMFLHTFAVCLWCAYRYLNLR